MPKLTRYGEVLYESDSRADCVVRAFELNLVYDRFARGKTNSLLPGVRIEDDQEVHDHAAGDQV